MLNQPLQILYNLPAIILGLTIHEFMHAYVAVKAGDNTPIIQGRLTLNPIKHLDPIGFLMFLLIGFGWAKPVQVNISNLKNKKQSFIFISLAGVFANLMLAFLAASILYFSNQVLISNQVFYGVLNSVMRINLILLALNILPIPPLDGFNVITTLAKFKNHNLIMNLKRYGFIILIILSLTKILGFYLYEITNLVINGFWSFFELIARLVG